MKQYTKNIKYKSKKHSKELDQLLSYIKTDYDITHICICEENMNKFKKMLQTLEEDMLTS